MGSSELNDASSCGSRLLLAPYYLFVYCLDYRGLDDVLVSVSSNFTDLNYYIALIGVKFY